MKVNKCDLCGKEIVKAKYDKRGNETLKLQLPAKDGSLLNVFIEVRCDKNATKEKLEKFQDTCNGMGIFCAEDADGLGENSLMKIFKMQEDLIDALEENKDTYLCPTCKKEVLKLAMAYGSWQRLKNINEAFEA